MPKCPTHDSSDGGRSGSIVLLDVYRRPRDDRDSSDVCSGGSMLSPSRVFPDRILQDLHDKAATWHVHVFHLAANGETNQAFTSKSPLCNGMTYKYQVSDDLTWKDRFQAQVAPLLCLRHGLQMLSERGQAKPP